MTAAKSTAYAALEVATGRRGTARVVNGQRIRFPARWARYYGDEYESSTFAWMRHSVPPGSVALDIGAHIGLMSVQLARCVGRGGHASSFDPSPGTRQVLERGRLNHIAHRVEVRPEAVSDHQGRATFYDTGNAVSAANTLVNAGSPLDEEGHSTSYEVPVTSVDLFAHARGLRPAFLKIDAEGVELDVLRGRAKCFASAARTLTSPCTRPPSRATATRWKRSGKSSASTACASCVPRPPAQQVLPGLRGTRRGGSRCGSGKRRIAPTSCSAPKCLT
jgi:FkbM family methyltransferase